jgi:hypothetical protein
MCFVLLKFAMRCCYNNFCDLRARKNAICGCIRVSIPVGLGGKLEGIVFKHKVFWIRCVHSRKLELVLGPRGRDDILARSTKLISLRVR